MVQRTDGFFIFGVLLLICNRLESLTSVEKIVNKYWLNKRDIKEFGRNVKGINLAPDEFRTGVMSHLPEVKRYLQREFLENAVRIRGNSNQSYSPKKNESKIKVDDLRLTLHTPCVKIQNGTDFLDKRIKYAYHSKSRFKPNELLNSAAYDNSQKLKKSFVSENQLRNFTTSAKEKRYSNNIKNKGSDEKRMEYADYHIRDRHNSKIRKVKRMTKEDNSKNSDTNNNSQRSRRNIPLKRAKEGPTSNVDLKEISIDDAARKRIEGSSEGNDRQDLCEDDDYDDDDEYGVYYYNDDANESDKSDDNITKNENGQNREGGNNCDNAVIEGDGGCPSKPVVINQKSTVILKTNIGLCSVWLVGLCLSIIVLTCGCFFIFVYCLERI